ncbi:hypothetical protein LshimejAT787_0402830 [Lyophyllum shimeji]|uniref:Uncharacterized protein n=1 Tax=Lyophyllum shimeji TaxID=47721 RepID=A0A9P3PKZ6_LYOSH|nr:hypothetical protein LshimejAT787_0402830 [Lyophyllum shimeji]
MASLSDQIDRLSRHTRAIKSTAAATAPTADNASVAGPFTRAVLFTPLGDLIRDIDPSELGLFSLPSSGASPAEITRAEFSGATPLRKHPPRRDDAPKSKEIEPEIYVQAALKCIDRYHAIRPMPRAYSQATAILESLTLVRERIQTLTQTLQQAQSVEGPPLKSLIDEEEKRVQDLQTRLAELQERKKSAIILPINAKPKKSAHVRPKPKPTAPPPPSSPQEDNFWNAPAAAARTLHFSDNLIDEQVDLGDVTTTLFMSPIPAGNPRLTPADLPTDESHTQVSTAPTNDCQVVEEDDQDEEDEPRGEEEQTVVLRKPPPETGTPEPRPASPPELSMQGTPTPASSETPSARQAKVKVNTEVERITARIWTTIGDMIMPGHPFNTSGRDVGSKPPRAKETIAHLETLSDLSPSPASPSASSASSASAGVPTTPTSQQILTAHLLLSLLSNPPHFSLPLNKAKDLLAAKAGAGAVAQGTTRIFLIFDWSYGMDQVTIISCL